MANASYAQRDVDRALGGHERVRIACSTCGATIGYYRPARVEKPPVEIALLWLKCMRKGCKTVALVRLDEVDVHNA